jgi:hypothetical protein
MNFSYKNAKYGLKLLEYIGALIYLKNLLKNCRFLKVHFCRQPLVPHPIPHFDPECPIWVPFSIPHLAPWIFKNTDTGYLTVYHKKNLSKWGVTARVKNSSEKKLPWVNGQFEEEIPRDNILPYAAWQDMAKIKNTVPRKISWENFV